MISDAGRTILLAVYSAALASGVLSCAERKMGTVEPSAEPSARPISSQTEPGDSGVVRLELLDGGNGNVMDGTHPALATTREAEDDARAPDGMLLVPGGTFTMGADIGGEEDEHPAHSVTIDSFWLDVTEVTVHDYLECVHAGVCEMYRTDVAKLFHAGDDSRFRHPDQPVTGISWDQAKKYCEYRGKRLPREAEWERAARGDDDRKFPWGNSAPNPTLHGCFARHVGTPDGTTCKVGAYPAGAGPYGHLDLAGNVWEWISDLYDPFAYRRPGSNRGEPGSCEQICETQDWLRHGNRQGFTGTNPIPTECERVLRGGAFNYPTTGLRVTNRVHHPGSWRLLMAGARCAMDARRLKAIISNRDP